MAARIYSLAKELKLDSKDLVDICVKAGVTGKGSALASLTDEEVDRIKGYLSGSSGGASRSGSGGSATATLAAPSRTAVAAAAPLKPPPMFKPTPLSKSVPVIKSVPKPAPAPPPVEPTVSEPTPVEVEEEPAPLESVPEPVALAPAPAEPVVPEPVSEVPASSTTTMRESGPIRREDYMAPGGGSGRPPVLGSRPERSLGRKPGGGEGGKPASKPSGPVIRVAQLPKMAAPPEAPKTTEPAPQKPDMRLPLDVMKAAKAVGGEKPLHKHMRSAEIKRAADVARQKTGGGQRGGPAGPLPAPVPLPSSEGRDRRRGGKSVAPVDEKADGTLGGREARQQKRKQAGDGRGRGAGEEERPSSRRLHRQKVHKKGTNTAAPRKGRVVVELPATIRGFSEAIGVPVSKVLNKLLAMGVMSNINAELDSERIELLAIDLGVEVELKQPVDLETQLVASTENAEDDPALLRPRPPVVTFLGHVDHGKTSLLDKIIGIDVVSGESGGITQHIRAYRIEKEDRPIAFVDTPGHEAFTQMRARGANVTDIAVLVVAADDGVMPQTEEAISHARAAGVPIVVALNKVDLPGINFDRIYTQLVTNGLQPTEWGGDTELVRCSALTGQGIDELLETLLTIAELHEYTYNPQRQAYGTCLEAEQHEGRGVVAKFLVQNGTLHDGDVVVCGSASGRVRAMQDTLKARTTYTEAGASTPVNVTGLDMAPGAGDHFYVVDDITVARTIAEKRAAQSRQTGLRGVTSHVTLENLHERLGGEAVQNLNLILRADVRGSIEAIQKELTKLDNPEVQVKVLQATVGGITEADVHLADASDAIIIGFNVVPDEGARTLAERTGVQVRRYEIIYKLTDDLRASLEGMLKPEQRDVELGRALVQRTFVISRLGTIAGCRVLVGSIERNARVRVIRENRIIGDYALESLRREKDDAREVREGYECGIKLVGFNDLKEGDILEAYKVEEFARTL